MPSLHPPFFAGPLYSMQRHDSTIRLTIAVLYSCMTVSEVSSIVLAQLYITRSVVV
jgi:hypothetical protein